MLRTSPMSVGLLGWWRRWQKIAEDFAAQSA